MPYVVTFWKPSVGFDPMQRDEVGLPLGESVRRKVVVEGQLSDFLQQWDSTAFLEEVLQSFTNARFLDHPQRLYWEGSKEKGETAFILKAGPQFAELSSFDADDDVVFQIFDISEKYDCVYYDWGN